MNYRYTWRVNGSQCITVQGQAHSHISVLYSISYLLAVTGLSLLGL